MRTATVKFRSNIIIFLVIIVSFSTISALATSMAFMVTDKIYSGVIIGDIAVGGLTVKEAESKIKSAIKPKLKEALINLNYKEDNWVVNADEIDLVIDYHELAQQAFNVGRRGNVFQQLKERYITINGGYRIPLVPIYNGNKLQLIIDKIVNEIDFLPRNAELVLAGGKVHVVSDKIGQKVNTSQLIEMINNKLQQGFPIDLEIPVNEVAPKIKTTDVEKIDTVIAMYTTQFDLNNLNRVRNVSLAAKSINGTLLRSGEVLSFNAIVGPRLEEFGYKEAPVFVDGKLVPDWGGGVCQVSSTLYNAALLADMSIEERTSHFRPPGYVPLGQDATVADNLLDFKFKNSLSESVYILSSINDNNLTVYILSSSNIKQPEVSIVASDRKVLEPNTIVKQDPNLELGREVVEAYGQKGFVVSISRIKKINGKEISRELISTDEYKPEDRVVRVGTRVFSNQATK